MKARILFQHSILLLLQYFYSFQVIWGEISSLKFNDFPSLLELPEGYPVSLECKSPIGGEVLWLKDGFPTSVNSTVYHITLGNRNDSGFYRCLISSRIGSMLSPSTHLQIQYFDGFDVDSTKYEISCSEGGYFVLIRPKLLSTPSTKIKFAWFKGETQVYTNTSHYITGRGDLVVVDVSQSSFGKYRVVASCDDLGKVVSKEYTVSRMENGIIDSNNLSIIYYHDDEEIISSPFPKEEVFDCVASAREEMRIRWFFDGIPILGSESGFVLTQNNRRLIMNNPTTFNEGRHKLDCKVDAALGRLFDMKSTLIIFKDTPKLRTIPNDVFKPIGSSLEIKCSVDKNHGTYNIILWYFNGKEIPSEHGKLSITSISRKNYGIYQCEVINDAGSDIATVWLRRESSMNASFDWEQNKGEISFTNSSKPLIIGAPQNVTLPVGFLSHTLKCVVRGDPTPSITWEFEGIEIQQTSSKYDISSKGLTIHELETSDSGLYTCEAKNSNGIAFASAKIIVPDYNLIENPPKNQSVLIGTNIEIPCEVRKEFKTNSQVMWFINGEPVPLSGNIDSRLTRNKKGSLIIQQVGPESIGEYSCTITSAGIEESASAFLKIIERPQMPTLVRAELINETTPSMIRISWLQGFDGNSPIIRHSIEMRTLGSSQLWSDWETVVETVPSEDCCAYLIDNVRPSVTAQFRVLASNRFGMGKPSLPSENVTMPQQPPAAAPRNVAASARSANSIIVQWQQPQEEQWSGDILGYIIRYRLAGYTLPWIEKNVTTKDARNAVIDQLITWRDYEIQIAAYNERGLGVFSKSIDVTTAEGVPIQAPKNVRCRVVNSTAVNVEFTAPDQQKVPGVNLGYKIEFWIGSPHNSVLYKSIVMDPTSKELSTIVGGLQKFGRYNLTVLCFTSPGDGPRSVAIEFVTEQDIPGPVGNLSVDEIMFDAAIVSWEIPKDSNGIIIRYLVRYWDDAFPNDKFEISLNNSRHNIKIDGLLSSTHYSVEVIASTVKGDGPRKEVKFESGVPPELPGRPNSLLVFDIQSRNVSLQFVPGFDGHTNIQHWIVEAKIADSSVFQVISNISASKSRFLHIDGLRPYTRYQLRLIAENIRGRGAPSEPSRPFMTKQTNPDTLSGRLYAEPISATGISLSWTPLHTAQWNGQAKGYLVIYREAGEEGWREIRTPSIRASEFSLHDLKPFTTYEIDLFAENMFGRSASSGISVTRTYESTPIAAPRNVRAEAVNIRSVSVRWDPVDKQFTNGYILGYTVRLEPESQLLKEDCTRQVDISDGNTLMTTISDLRVFTSYMVFVSAYTVVGRGPENLLIVIQTGEDLPGAPSSVAFSLISENEVRLKWTPPENPNGKIKAYLVNYWRYTEGRSNSIRVPLSSTLYGFSANGLVPNELYVFTIQAENTIGVGPETEVKVLTSSVRVPLRNPPLPLRNESVPYTSTEIAIRWDDFSIDEEEETPVRFVKVEYEKANGNGWVSLDKNIGGYQKGIVVTRLSANSLYRFRIRYQGDSSLSVWSAESSWMRTLPSPPFTPPNSIVPSPYDSNSLLMQWNAPPRNTWNSDTIGYYIFYRIYPSNNSWISEEIAVSNEKPEKEEYIIRKLTSFRHYIIRMRTFNNEGSSPFSPPVFIYVGYSIPKRKILNVLAEARSSSSISVQWDPWINDSDVISGFKIRYVPVTSVISDSSHDEDMVIVENNSCLINDLRKYTDYQISITPYNRAGEGAVSQLRVRTLEDIPGPVGQLRFTDVLLDSVHLSWDPPVQPNGVVTGYIVNYRTFKMQEEFKKEVQSRTQQTFYPAAGLEQGVTYFFAVWAETAVGRGMESTGNITVGSNPDGPSAPTRPSLIPGQSSVTLEWKDTIPHARIIGHLIQTKRISKAMDFDQMIDGKRHRRAYSFRPTHVIGEWITLKTIEGIGQSHEISYHELQPSSFYVFRIYARNRQGVGPASSETEQLFVPASIPEDPFYTTWWFIVMVAMSTFVIIVIVIAFLCITGTTAKYRREKRNSIDSLQLADGNFITFQMKNSRRNVGRDRSDLLNRPATTQSWLSDRDPPAYGSILGERDRESANGGSVVNMYGLATDVISPQLNQEALQKLSVLVGRDMPGSNSVYISDSLQNDSFNIINRGGYGSRSEYDPDRSDYAQGDYSTRSEFASAGILHGDDYDTNSFDEDEETEIRQDLNSRQTDNIANHYDTTDEYRDTWRRVKASEGVPGTSIPLSVGTSSVESSSAWMNQQVPNLTSGFSSFV